MTAPNHSSSAPLPVRIYQVQPVQGALPAWLNSFLCPVLAAIKADAVPVEIRPLGRFGGLSAGPVEFNPDRRIKVNSRIVFSSKSSIAHVFVHEICHGLLDDVENGISHSHNAAFYCLNLTLLRRLDDAKIDTGNASLHANSMSCYDHQDPIFCWKKEPESMWRPRELAWAIEMADKFRDSELTAKEIAAEVHEAYFEFSDRMAAEPAKKAAEKKLAAQRRAREIQELGDAKSGRFLFKTLFSMMLALLFTVVYFVPAA